MLRGNPAGWHDCAIAFLLFRLTPSLNICMHGSQPPDGEELAADTFALAARVSSNARSALGLCTS